MTITLSIKFTVPCAGSRLPQSTSAQTEAMFGALRRRSETSTQSQTTSQANSATQPQIRPIMLPSSDRTTTTTTTSLADSDYARKRREVYKLLKELMDVGASSEIAIPEIAVIGGQSAGKSSLVEAITGISVPRDSGTCTRCPMRCRVFSDTKAWSCDIFLQISPDAGSSNTRERFSPPITSKAEVELWIRRAQIALLNPTAPRNSFVTKTEQELRAVTTSLEFSKSIVEIDIYDPRGIELAFIDLPGLIQNDKDEVIELVESLTESYIAEKHTIILVTLPASGKPVTHWNCCVVTKPDQLLEGNIGAHKAWLDIIQGRSEHDRLKHGYYVTRLPDDEQRGKGITRAELDAEAQRFFASKAPWKNLSPGRLGLPNLIAFLSELLMKVIEDSIPRLKAEANARLATVKLDISRLPTMLTMDPMTEVVGRISDFCTALRNDVHGRNEDRRDFPSESISYPVDLTDFRPFETVTNHVRPPSPDHAAGNNVAPESGDPDDNVGSKPMGLIEVRKVIEDFIGWEMPPAIPREAKEYLIGLSVNQWLGPALLCFKECTAILHRYIDKHIVKHFGDFKALENYMRPIIMAAVEHVHDDVDGALRDVVLREGVPYRTENVHYYESIYRGWLHHYRVVDLYADYYVLGFYNPSMTRVHRTLQIPSNYENEMQLMAHVRAYVQVAYKRIIDHVPRTIQRDLNQVFADGLKMEMLSKLKLDDPDTSERLKELLKEDPERAAERKRLMEIRGRLEIIISKLNKFVV
ncbi:P-loop containing nucleoside triphosphate hydrolase protein [Fomitopsis serialis]|uniref:P-loop containing nucleoside triphosphate hydrolase protein n=1 Tax=Fomitopsis serialis TaxID=139415 RepID=UPI002007241E|nr:P-loop containing nucleoside triphosphate hydrolase protein [Neoantrodia serialis]KAH9917729.1 P-loop containing nucleoside triphosphate hydrolase protein [Neoantrodia serialis]